MASELDLAGAVNLPRVGTVTTSASGAPDDGSCVDLGDAAGYYLTASIANLVDYAADFAINIWSNSSAFSSIGNWIINQRNNTTERKFQIRVNATNLNTAMFPGGGVLSALASSPGTGTWRMTTMVKRGANLEHWANGSLAASEVLSGAIETGNAPFALGAGSWVPTVMDVRHRGRLFAAGMWSRALSAPEVVALYNSGSGRRFAAL